ncbi:c-type cytochrome [Thermodesulfobacteriota bacterium]
MTKSVLALILTGSAILGFFAIFELLGRKEKRMNPKLLRAFHRLNGYFFFLFFLFISYYCLKIMRGMGQDLSARAALHGILATAAFMLLCIKILIIRVYRQYYSMVAPIGIAVLLLTLGTTATSAGYYFVMRGAEPVVVSSEIQNGLVAEGAKLFQESCAFCHDTKTTEKKIGPGLKGLFKGKALPSSGLPVTQTNIRKQLKTPVSAMPAFPDLSEREVEALLAFLESL